jgi:hypothetical protein
VRLWACNALRVQVYRGLWRGSPVAVKTLLLPASLSPGEKREKMVVMETAISSSLSHPNIVQTFTYSIRWGAVGLGTSVLVLHGAALVRLRTPVDCLHVPPRSQAHAGFIAHDSPPGLWTIHV